VRVGERGGVEKKTYSRSSQLVPIISNLWFRRPVHEEEGGNGDFMAISECSSS